MDQPEDAAITPLPQGIRQTWRRRLALLAVGATAACSPVRMLNRMAPDRLAAEGVAYGPGPRQLLDVYAPVPQGRPAPVVVFFYGGNWDSGDRADYRFVGASLAARGCLALVPDYRLHPQVRFPDFLRDCALAVAWARENARRWGGDPARLFVMGHSAGAYNAAMLALDPEWLGAVGMVPRRDLAGAVGIAGPYDFLPLRSAMLMDLFGPEAMRPRTQPIAFADGGNPPMLLLHGASDTLVEPGNTIRLAERIRSRGGSVKERIYPDLGHQLIAGALSGSLRLLAPTLRDSLAFIGSPGGERETV
ncbi:alpha/beta hydrolase [Roseococcus sp.]|uniref:alpha/beta hydrolase n=1 Tax=Roseococcus sp. TaxID=2109646 RepID=UPI003BA890EE